MLYKKTIIYQPKNTNIVITTWNGLGWWSHTDQFLQIQIWTLYLLPICWYLQIRNFPIILLQTTQKCWILSKNFLTIKHSCMISNSNSLHIFINQHMTISLHKNLQIHINLSTGLMTINSSLLWSIIYYYVAKLNSPLFWSPIQCYVAPLTLSLLRPIM